MVRREDEAAVPEQARRAASNAHRLAHGDGETAWHKMRAADVLKVLCR